MTKKRVSAIYFKQFSEFAGLVASSLWDIVKDTDPKRIQELTEHPENLRKILRQAFNPSSPSMQNPVFQRDMSKEEEWRLVKNTEEQALFLPRELELISVFKEEEKFLDSGILISRARKAEACLGQLQAEHLLKHREEIPEEWREFRLVFPGTVWVDKVESKHFPFLEWCYGRWCLDFRADCFGFGGFNHPDRLVRPRS